MMPSRGWHLARGNAPRLFQLQCRNLSSASRRIPQTPLRNTLAATSTSRWQRSIPVIATTSIAIRNASTNTPNPQPISSAAASPSAPVSESHSFPNLDTITLDNIDLSTTADVTEKIGYLHEIGLNYGWGPTSILEWTMEHIHIYGGVPWWVSFVATAWLLRIALVPLYLRASDCQARQLALGPITKPITDRLKAAQKANDKEGVQLAWNQLSETRRRAGITFTAQFAPLVFQGIFAFCGFRLIRAMATLPVPALRTDGFLWLQDLTLSDPYLLLPAMMGGSIYLLVRMGGETGAQAQAQMGAGMQKFMLYGMPALAVLFTGWQPGAICVWFAANGTWGIAQARVLQNSAVRRFFKLAPLYKPGKEENDAGPLAAMLGGRLGDMSGSSPKSKNTTFMNPTYQAPNLRRSSSSRSQFSGQVIDVKAANRSDASGDTDMVQPTQKKAPGVLERASKAFSNVKDMARKESVQTPGEVEERRRKAFKKRADDYEARFQKKKGGGK